MDAPFLFKVGGKMTEFQKEYYSGMIEFLSATFGETIEISLFEVLEKKSKSILQNYHGKKKMEICLEFLFTIFKMKKRI